VSLRRRWVLLRQRSPRIEVFVGDEARPVWALRAGQRIIRTSYDASEDKVSVWVGK
jgi:hypothetical protein